MYNERIGAPVTTDPYSTIVSIWIKFSTNFIWFTKCFLLSSGLRPHAENPDLEHVYITVSKYTEIYLHKLSVKSGPQKTFVLYILVGDAALMTKRMLDTTAYKTTLGNILATACVFTFHFCHYPNINNCNVRHISSCIHCILSSTSSLTCILLHL